MRPRKKDRHLPNCVYFKHGRHWYVKGGKWHPLSPNLADALEEYAKLATGPQGGMAELIDRVFAAVKPKLKQSTVDQYELAVRRLKDHLAEFSPEQVRPRDVAAIKNDYTSTPNLGNRIISFLRVVFDYALEWQLVDGNPCIGIKRHEEKKRNRYLTDREFKAIREAASPSGRAIFDIAYYTGQRIGDVLSIRLSDVTDEGIAFMQQKTGQRVLIKMAPELEDAVKAAKALPRPVRGLTLFCTLRGGRKYSYSTVKEMWDRACKNAGVEDAHLHDLRAKAITDAKKQGKNAQALGGHTTEAMTNRYIRARDTIVADPPSFGLSNKKKVE